MRDNGAGAGRRRVVIVIISGRNEREVVVSK